MAVLKAARTSQDPKVAEFIWNFSDTMLNTSDVSADFGQTNTSATTFEVINLPPNSVVIGGELVVETAFDTASYAIVIGDSGVADRYHASADRKAAARTALTLTGFRNVDGLNIRIGITNADACTTGKASLKVMYIVEGRAGEVQPV